MAKYNIYGPFAGVKDVFTLLALMEDKKKRKEFLGVVKALENEREALNEAIEVYGKASKIDGLVSEAATNVALAEATLKKAMVSAEEIREKAKNWADDLGQKAQERATAVTHREDRVSVAESELARERARNDERNTKREDKLSRDEKAAATLMAQGNDLKNRYHDALERMKENAAAA